MCPACGGTDHGQVQIGLVGGLNNGPIGDLNADGVGGGTFVDDRVCG
jgi:hypothetical protein